MKRDERPIITTILDGGLGNQMFQYAAARRLAHVTRGELLLQPLADGPAGTHQVYGLRSFNISGRELPAINQLPREDRSLTSRIIRRLPALLRGNASLTPVFEKFLWVYLEHVTDPGLIASGDLLFMPDLLTRRRDTTLCGFWQNERYFGDIAEIIRSDFSLKTPLDDQTNACLARIQSRQSVFLHVRRGDYLTPPYDTLFGACDGAYYHQALAILRDRYGPDLQVLVFSNDHGWVEENRVGGEDALLVDWNAHAPERDLMLMRACRHAVIANSSFSWWGAWLGQTPEQTVIAPRIWFKALPEYRDIVPDRWIRL